MKKKIIICKHCFRTFKMEPWKKVCTYVSVYAILREFRPIDPFFIQYLTLLPEKYTIQTVSLFKLKIIVNYYFNYYSIILYK